MRVGCLLEAGSEKHIFEFKPNPRSPPNRPETVSPGPANIVVERSWLLIGRVGMGDRLATPKGSELKS